MEKLIIVRHGEAENNISLSYNSSPTHANYSPSSLTELGINQVRATAKKLKNRGITSKENIPLWVSPLPRTLQTAHILIQEGVFSAYNLSVEELLIELQAGEAEGKTAKELGIDDIWNIEHLHSLGGESTQELEKRMLTLLDKITSTVSEKSLALVTHGAPASQLLDCINSISHRFSLSEAYLIDLTKKPN